MMPFFVDFLPLCCSFRPKKYKKCIFTVADLVDDLSLVYSAFDSFEIKVGALGKSICSLSDLYYFSYFHTFFHVSDHQTNFNIE